MLSIFQRTKWRSCGLYIFAFVCLSAAANKQTNWVVESTAAPVIHEEQSTLKEFGVSGIKGLRARFVVAAPVDATLKLLWDIRRFPDLFTGIENMKVLSSTDTTIEVYFEVDAVIRNAEYRLERKLDRKARTIRWREIGEGDVKYARGSWTVEPGAEGYSMVTYASFVDVGYAVPTGLVRAMAIRKVDELASRIRGALSPQATSQ